MGHNRLLNRLPRRMLMTLAAVSATQLLFSMSASAQLVMQGPYKNETGDTLSIKGSAGFYTGTWQNESVKDKRINLGVIKSNEFSLGAQVCRGTSAEFICIRESDGRKRTYVSLEKPKNNAAVDGAESELSILRSKLAAEEKARRAAEEKLAAETIRQAELKAATEAGARRQAEQRLAEEAEAKKLLEQNQAIEAQRQAAARIAAEAESRRQLEQKLAAEIESRQKAEAKLAAETESRRLAEEKKAAESLRQAELKAEAERDARRQAEQKREAEILIRQQAEQKLASETNRSAAIAADQRRQAEIDATARKKLEGQVVAQNQTLRQQDGRISAAEREAAEARKTAEGARGVLANILLPINENPDSWMMRVSAIPIQQQQFCRIVDRFHNDLESVYRARNDIRKNALYRERLRDFGSLLPRGEIANWVVKIVEVTQAPDGSAAVALQLPCRAMLGSDACRPNAARFSITIPKTSNIYRELEKVATNDFVAISGTIILVRDGVPDRPLPEYASYQPGAHCSSAEGGKTQDMFITDVKYLIRLN
jgi:hypothetical protein